MGNLIKYKMSIVILHKHTSKFCALLPLILLKSDNTTIYHNCIYN
nr:MAG TPA: hypothetical protein [Bacteriophage sp.]